MSTQTIKTICPICGEKIKFDAEFPDPIIENAATDMIPTPDVQGKLDPVGNILVYKISSEQMKDFIISKAREHVRDIRMTIVPRYCEKKRKNNSDPHRSYASLRIAFSENVIEKKEDLGWYGSIGESSNNVQIHHSIMNNLINKYQYNRKEIDAWLKNYKTLEELEENFGMTEDDKAEGVRKGGFGSTTMGYSDESALAPAT